MSYQEEMTGVKYTILEYIKKWLNNNDGGATAFWVQELDKYKPEDDNDTMFLLGVI